MPSFNTLPTEVLFCIARFLGSQYLQARAERLLLFREWQQVARLVAFEGLTLSIKNLPRFLNAPQSAHKLVQFSARRLSVKGRNLLGTGGLQYHLEEELRSRNREICQSLNSSAKFLPSMVHLKSFQLKFLMNSLATLAEEKRWSQTIISLISYLPPSVMDLTIDKPGEAPRVSAVDLGDNISDSDKDYSICHLLCDKAFLPSLRRLRLQTRVICPKVLEMNSSGQHPLLETIVLNLSLHEQGMNVAHQARFCLGYEARKKGLHLHMMDAAEANAVQFPALRTLRILYPKFPTLQVASHDAVPNRNVVLPEHVHWEDVDWDGEEFTDPDVGEETEVDLFNDSSSEPS